MSPTIIRPIENSDLVGAAAALIDVHSTDGYPVEGVEEPEAWLCSADVMAAWVGDLEGTIVGHVAVMHARDEDAVSMWMQRSGEEKSQIAVLARLFVTKGARTHAVGERLMRAAMAYGRECELRLVLDVMTKDIAAMRLYERLGWFEIGKTSHPYGRGQSIEAVCYAAPEA
ncbi:GNAT family N-acetyltransferase [Streptomyces niveus]|uniref:GNAT family N-acetyltransferase n=1 Tax=Streptomyces niveus TaxID=193462 RepID=UPI003443D269